MQSIDRKQPTDWKGTQNIAGLLRWKFAVSEGNTTFGIYNLRTCLKRGIHRRLKNLFIIVVKGGTSEEVAQIGTSDDQRNGSKREIVGIPYHCYYLGVSPWKYTLKVANRCSEKQDERVNQLSDRSSKACQKYQWNFQIQIGRVLEWELGTVETIRVGGCRGAEMDALRQFVSCIKWQMVVYS